MCRSVSPRPEDAGLQVGALAAATADERSPSRAGSAWRTGWLVESTAKREFTGAAAIEALLLQSGADRRGRPARISESSVRVIRPMAERRNGRSERLGWATATAVFSLGERTDESDRWLGYTRRTFFG